MTSPFQVFRKNQKMWVAGLVILAMFGFVFLPTILETMGGRGGSNPVAFESKYGDLHESQLHNLRERHLATMGILGDLLRQPGVSASDIQQWLKNRFGGSTLDDVADSWLLARHAKEMGMVVSNEMINVFIKQITQNQVKVDVLQAAFKRSGISDRMFFEIMRDELLAWKLKQIFYPSVVAATPGQRWDYFCRVKRSAAIEAAPVAVADYVDQIQDPTDEELRAFFEEHKGKLPLPFSPEPGFKKPQRVALEYFKAETDKFNSPEMISDEEVMQRYEKDKQRYDQFFPEPVTETPADDEQTATDKKEDVKDADNSNETASPPKETTPEPSSPKTEPTEQEEENSPPKKGATAGLSSSAGRSTRENTAGQASSGTRTLGNRLFQRADSPPKDSAASGKSPFILAAFQQPEAGEKTEPEPTEKPEPAGEKPQPADKPASSLPPPASSLQPKTGPSERLKDYIRQEIAGEKINVLFDRLSGHMNQYREKQSDYDFNLAAKKEGKSPPVRPDFEKLAKQNGLTAGRTGLVADWDAAESEIGSALVKGGARAWQYAFRSMAKLRPEKAMDLGGNLYLFWKTEDAKEKVSKFEDEGVREEALRAWKMIRARELAKKEAESLAAEAREADKPFAQVFAGRPKLPVLTPPPFTWMTFGSASLSFPRQPEISAVEGVDIAGDEFMRTVFRLEPGEVGAAMNAPQTAAYAVRLIEYSPSYKVLWEWFKVDDFRKYSAVAEGDQNQMYRAWINEIRTTAGFKWTDEHKKRLQAGDSGR